MLSGCLTESRLFSNMDNWETYVKTTSSESGASRVVVDLDCTLGAALFEGSCEATDLSASVSGSSSLSPKDDGYEVVESDSSEEVRIHNNCK